ncbi:transcriptional regulator, Crp/Fnr family [Cellulophaga algicola DSM 14237]|uniref:Transcriptional regulator, Crp/Fnr family n=1 Tax=Cellulophaga algicola (strain DSM 14237 / IC166 / ACAM 630) TaxID=688270 RepID=E6X7Q6_CELAD|nr:helix-turn-helix domain-containing protein [Cellulophaga algicola]ADV50766.1 transcriptional regulator, Crp/Fnr family [Cellulophaga algicola DSM 14237]
MKTNLFPHDKFSFDNQDLLSGLPEAVCKTITKNSVIIHFKAGDAIFIEDNTPEGIYSVKNGKVKKFTVTDHRKEHIFYICKEGEYLVYHAVLSEELYPDCASALTDCDMEFIPKEDFIKAVDKSPILSKRLLRSLGHEFGVFLKATKILAKYTVRERTALNLLILESKYKNNQKLDTEISIHREDLASMVGTAMESVVRMLKDFKEEKLISTKRSSIFIKDHKGLLKVANFN